MPRGGARANSGGVRVGAGRPRRNLHLDTETARLLATLTKQQRQVAPAATEETMLAALIRQAYEGTQRRALHLPDDNPSRPR
jgi:hypothetical protein